MATLEQVEEQVKPLTKAEQEALLDWLGNMLEDEFEFTDEFKAKIERGESDNSGRACACAQTLTLAHEWRSDSDCFTRVR